MFELKLKLSKAQDGSLHLHFPVIFRLTLFILAGLLISVMILNQQVEVLPAILALVSLAGGLYTEHWHFDLPGGRIIHRYGVAPLTQKVVFSISEIENFTLHRFYKGRLGLPGPPEAQSRGGVEGPSPGSAGTGVGADAGIPRAIEEVEAAGSGASRFSRILKKTVYSLSFEHATEGRVVIESQTNQQMEDWAWKISRYCQLPLGFDDQRGEAG